MSCYHPMVAQFQGEYTANGKKKYKFVGSALDPRYKNINEDMIYLPCGQCIGCRLDYSRKWADRMILELATMKKAVFVTLTYDEKSYKKVNGSLNKKDCQNFMKDIRRKYKNTKVRFYLSGEYGELYHRCHYHVILYGLDIHDFENKEKPLKLEGRNQLGQPYYGSQILDDIWKKGHCCVCNVSWNTFAYVARYTLKKLDHKDWRPEDHGKQREFSLMSRNPGIGADYLKLHGDCLDLITIPIGTEDGLMNISIPQYFIRRVEKENPDCADLLKKERQKYASDKQMLKLFGYEKRYDELLRDEERQKLADTGIIKQTRCKI